MRYIYILPTMFAWASAWAGPTINVTDTEAALAENMALARVLTVRPSSEAQQLNGAQQGTVLRDDVRMGGKSCNLTVAPVPSTAAGRGGKLMGTTNVVVVQRAPSTVKC